MSNSIPWVATFVCTYTSNERLPASRAVSLTRRSAQPTELIERRAMTDPEESPIVTFRHRSASSVFQRLSSVPAALAALNPSKRATPTELTALANRLRAVRLHSLEEDDNVRVKTQLRYEDENQNDNEQTTGNTDKDCRRTSITSAEKVNFLEQCIAQGKRAQYVDNPKASSTITSRTPLAALQMNFPGFATPSKHESHNAVDDMRSIKSSLNRSGLSQGAGSDSIANCDRSPLSNDGSTTAPLSTPGKNTGEKSNGVHAVFDSDTVRGKMEITKLGRTSGSGTSIVGHDENEPIDADSREKEESPMKIFGDGEFSNADPFVSIATSDQKDATTADVRAFQEASEYDQEGAESACNSRKNFNFVDDEKPSVMAARQPDDLRMHSSPCVDSTAPEATGDSRSSLSAENMLALGHNLRDNGDLEVLESPKKLDADGESKVIEETPRKVMLNVQVPSPTTSSLLNDILDASPSTPRNTWKSNPHGWEHKASPGSFGAAFHPHLQENSTDEALAEHTSTDADASSSNKDTVKLLSSNKEDADCSTNMNKNMNETHVAEMQHNGNTDHVIRVRIDRTSHKSNGAAQAASENNFGSKSGPAISRSGREGPPERTPEVDDFEPHGSTKIETASTNDVENELPTQKVRFPNAVDTMKDISSASNERNGIERLEQFQTICDENKEPSGDFASTANGTPPPGQLLSDVLVQPADPLDCDGSKLSPSITRSKPEAMLNFNMSRATGTDAALETDSNPHPRGLDVDNLDSVTSSIAVISKNTKIQSWEEELEAIEALTATVSAFKTDLQENAVNLLPARKLVNDNAKTIVQCAIRLLGQEQTALIAAAYSLLEVFVRKNLVNDTKQLMIIFDESLKDAADDSAASISATRCLSSLLSAESRIQPFCGGKHVPLSCIQKACKSLNDSCSPGNQTARKVDALQRFLHGCNQDQSVNDESESSSRYEVDHNENLRECSPRQSPKSDISSCRSSNVSLGSAVGVKEEENAVLSTPPSGNAGASFEVPNRRTPESESAAIGCMQSPSIVENSYPVSSSAPTPSALPPVSKDKRLSGKKITPLTFRKKRLYTEEEMDEARRIALRQAMEEAVELHVDERIKLERRVHSIERERNELKSILAEYEDTMNKVMECENSKSSTHVREIEKQNDTLHAELLRTKDAFERLRRGYELLESEKAEAQVREKTLQDQNKTLKSSMIDLQKWSNDLKANTEKKLAKSFESATRVHEQFVQAEARAKSAREQLEINERDVSSKMQRIAVAESKISELETALRDAKSSQSEQAEELMQARKQCSHAETKMAALRKEIAGLQDKVQRYEKVSGSISHAESSSDALHSRLDTLLKENQGLKARAYDDLTSLENLRQQLENKNKECDELNAICEELLGKLENSPQ